MTYSRKGFLLACAAWLACSTAAAADTTQIIVVTRALCKSVFGFSSD